MLALGVLGVVGVTAKAQAQAPSATDTSLSVSFGGNAVTTVDWGSSVTLTASVTSGGSAVKSGQVTFCDAAAKSCSDIHLLGTAQLTGSGSAVLSIRPSRGTHNYKALFLGTKTCAASASNTATLTVTGLLGTLATTTSISETGVWGAYTGTATVTEIGSTSPPTGTASFLDASNGNAVLGKGSLGAATAGITWLKSSLSAQGAVPSFLLQADFNGDGIADLAIVGGYSASVTVYLGKGDGTFVPVNGSAKITSSTGGVTAGDFNGDGIVDLAITNSYNNSVTILLGKGDGTFNTAVSSQATGVNPSSIVTADFNGDGLADLAVTTGNYQTPYSVAILLGNGDGTFTAASTSVSAPSDAAVIVAGDFNGDGRIDLVVNGSSSAALQVLLGNGDGTFTAGAQLQINNGPLAIAVADFNGDGVLDLIGSATNLGTVKVLLGNGDGTFKDAPAAFPQVKAEPDRIVVGDFDGDGIPDVAVICDDYQNGGPEIFRGNGDGTFTPSLTDLGWLSGAIVAAGDFDANGRTDLVIGGNLQSMSVYLLQPTQTSSGSASFSLGAGLHKVNAAYSGDSNYQSSTSSTLSMWGAPAATTTALAITAGGAPATSVSTGTVVTLTANVAVSGTPVSAGQVKFCGDAACTDALLAGSAALSSGGSAVLKLVPAPGSHTYYAAFLENGYGAASVSNAVSLTVGPAKAPVYTDSVAIAASGNIADYTLTATVIGYGGTASPTGNVSFLDTSYGNASLGSAVLGTSTPGIGWIGSQISTTGQYPQQQAVADFNGDGIPDIAELLQPTNYSGPYSVTIQFGKGDGTFTQGPTNALAGVQNEPQLKAGDWNGDGKADLAILNSDYSQNVYVTALLGNGDGTFGTPVTTTAIRGPNMGGDYISGSLAAADFNGDGKMDLAAVGDYISGGLVILLGNGDGSFTPTGTAYAQSQAFSQVATGDFNGDGIPDLIASTYLGPEVAMVFLGKGDGSFASAGTISPGSFPGTIVLADFNGDGKLDAAFGYDSAAIVFLGKGDGTFTSVSGTQYQSAGYGLVAGDFNSDGKLDLAGLDSYSGHVDLLLGNGDGTFTPLVTSPVIPMGIRTQWKLSAADLNGDGRPDLVFVDRCKGQVTTLLNQPTQTATAVINHVAPVGPNDHSVMASYPGDSNYPAGDSATTTLFAGLKPVVISPAGGAFTTPQTVTITEEIPGATIYYWANGPVSTTGWVQYNGPISLPYGGTEYIQAYAQETGYAGSPVATANLNLNFPVAPAPAISPAGGAFDSPQTVTITDTLTNASIYYSTDGAYPTIAYTGPITVSNTATVAAVARVSGYTDSPATTAAYFLSSSQNRFVYTVAGNQAAGYAGDGGPAVNAFLDGAVDVASDGNGSVYIADQGNNVVRKLDTATGLITTVAGTSTPGYSGDGGPATHAQLNSPYALAVDAAGNLYIADSWNRVARKVEAHTGIISTVAGSTTAQSPGDGGPATSAGFGYLNGLAVDTAGNLYISSDSRIRVVNASTGTITTFAGNGGWGYNGDNGPATSATLSYPAGIAFDAAGNLYFADQYTMTVRKIAKATGIITTVAGSGPNTNGNRFGGDGGPATQAYLNDPVDVKIDAAGNLYISDSGNGAIREVTANNGIINTIAGTPSRYVSLTGDGQPATNVTLSPRGIDLDRAGNLYVGVSTCVRVITPPVASPSTATAAPVFSISPGTYSGTQTVSLSSSTPGSAIYVTLDGTDPATTGLGYQGPIKVTGNVTIKAIALAPGFMPSSPASGTYTITTPPTALISTVAGTGKRGTVALPGPATSTPLNFPAGLALDSAGNLYIVDTNLQIVWQVSAATGNASVFAGTPGQARFGGDGGPATSATLNFPTHVAVDTANNVYITDSSNYRIRKVDAKTGIISTYAGGGFNFSNPGDGGPATSASLHPVGLAFDAAGNLYIADDGSRRIRLVNAATGIITSVAGSNNSGLGDGGPATSASIDPSEVALDAAGNLYIVESYKARLRVVNAKTGIINTIAGYGVGGQTGDGGPATAAQLSPKAIAVDVAGNLYIANWWGTIRKVSASDGTITTIAGSGYYGFGGDGGSATVAELRGPTALAIDASGNLYVSDSYNYSVRKVSFPGPAPTPTFTPAAGTYAGPQTITISDATPGARIYYTVDGSDPSTASNLYSAPLAVSATQTVKAIAVATGYTESAAASATYTIVPLPSATVTVTSSLNPSLTTNNVTFSVSVTGTSGTPTGTVTLMDGASQLGVVTLKAGAASYSTSSLTEGSHSITAMYSGDSNFAAGASSAFKQDVESYTIGVATGGSNSATVSAGGQATFKLSVTPPATGSALTFSVTGLPAGATANFSPSTVAPGAPGTVVTLTIAVPAKAAVPTQSATNRTAPAVALALLLLPFAARFRGSRAWLSMLLLGSAAVMGTLALAGCGGGGGSSSGGGSGTGPQTYTLTVTATSASLTQSTTLSLTVN